MSQCDVAIDIDGAPGQGDVATIERNTITPSSSAGRAIDVARISTATIAANFIGGYGDVSTGIYLLDTGGFIFKNRITTQRFAGIHYQYQTTDGDAPVALIMNNTVAVEPRTISNGAYSVASFDGTDVPVRLFNNIAVQYGEGAADTASCAFDRTTGVDQADYLVHNGFAFAVCEDNTVELGPNSTNGDPLIDSTDLRLLGGGPAIDSGLDDPNTPSEDFEGDIRPDGEVDIGADEL